MKNGNRGEGRQDRQQGQGGGRNRQRNEGQFAGQNTGFVPQGYGPPGFVPQGYGYGQPPSFQDPRQLQTQGDQQRGRRRGRRGGQDREQQNLGGQRQAQGPHVGKGPKGYKRSDERIREEVCERLTLHPQIDASEIEVNVKNGEVSLTGSVNDRQTKFRVEQAIDRILGVQDISNQLRITRQTETGTSETISRQPAVAQHHATS